MPYERVKFADFMKTFSWKQGEHVMLAANTQCGKTTLTSYLVARRSHVAILATKPKDENLRKRYADYHKYGQWPPDREDKRVLIWPAKQRKLTGDVARQRVVLGDALDSVANEGGWCVVVDEMHYTAQFLRLDREVAILHHQGSSSGISMVTLTQRPAWIPKIIYTSATHAFIGSAWLPDDLRTLGAMGGPYGREVKDTVQQLGRHDLLYVNPLGDAEPVIINIRY